MTDTSTKAEGRCSKTILCLDARRGSLLSSIHRDSFCEGEEPPSQHKKNQPTGSVFFEPPGRPVEARSWGELLTILLSALRRIQIDSELALKELLNESLTCATSLGEIRRELGGLLRSLAKQRKYWCEKLQLLTWKRCISV